ncbi:hypothetical protein [Tepidibacter aestuarii]|uniref:hypothetical protein n=1 Tax=Tepidibacter aestuarii TaxID=2925782 RepID=UPI0020BEDCF7|nr:hypothetical protein [Tepidibacter aestuarii]CAH2212196.1 protein of unknown function [Tepidibacter aestuarii]
MYMMERKNLEKAIKNLSEKTMKNNLSRFFVEDGLLYHKTLVWKTREICSIDEIKSFKTMDNNIVIQIYNNKNIELSLKGVIQ